MALLQELTVEALYGLRESYEVEFKAAQGRDGRGALPESVWATYSAFANTHGGYLVLGVREREENEIDVLGLLEPERVLRDFWNGVNNLQRVSDNLLGPQPVRVMDVQGRAVLVVEVPRAPRKRRPVYVEENPFTGTFRRNHEGDYRCSRDAVRRMIAEAEADDRDGRLLEGFTLNDLDLESLNAYRHLFWSTCPNHPWVQFDDLGFLRSLGGWKRERDSGREGLTLAGLLMFGSLPSIREVSSTFLLDYQERTDSENERGIRWSDRVTTDGSWPGNLFRFFQKAYTRLTADLPVPFRINPEGRRIDETYVHEALREALVNTLIHADYEAGVGILVVKQPGRITFRNPGHVRVPHEVVYDGGISDCRNPALQKMFQLMGMAEQAGSGFPKILRAWQAQDWRRPLLREHEDPEYTVLELVMAPLLTPQARERLKPLGAGALPELEQLGLYLALEEGETTVRRMAEVSGASAMDVRAPLERLEQSGFLVKRWQDRAWRYTLSLGTGPATRFEEVREFGPSRFTPSTGLRRTHPFPRSVRLPAESA